MRRIGYELAEPGLEGLLFVEHDVEGSSQDALPRCPNGVISSAGTEHQPQWSPPLR